MTAPETRRRSLAKALSWRLTGVLVLAAVAAAQTDDWTQILSITLWFNAIRIVMYYFHERLWLRIPWGYRDPGVQPASSPSREEVETAA